MQDDPGQEVDEPGVGRKQGRHDGALKDSGQDEDVHNVDSVQSLLLLGHFLNDQ